MPWQGYNKAATALTDDPDEATICAFYWNPPDQHGMPRYESSGVMLQLVDLRQKPFDCHDRHNRLVRPIVRPPPPQARTDYVVEFTVRIICGNEQDLMSFHWPRFQASRWPDGVDYVDVDAKTHMGKPNIVRVRQSLRSFREHEAVAYCLAFAQGLRIKLENDTNFCFTGERYPWKEYSDGISGVVMKRN